MFVCIIVVVGDGVCVDIDVIVNFCIVQIGQMICFGVFFEMCFFYFYEVINVGVCQQFGVWVQMGKWIDGVGCLQLGIFYYVVGVNFVVIVDGVVFDYVVGVDFYLIVQYYVVFQNNVSIDFYIVFVLQCIVQIEMCWIVQYYVCQQQFFCLFCLVDVFQVCKLQVVVDVFDFVQVLWMYCDDLVFFLVCYGDDIGDVVFILSVVIGEFCQLVFQICFVGDQDFGVDFLDLVLGFVGIFVFNDVCYLVIFMGNVVIVGWVIQFYC